MKRFFEHLGKFRFELMFLAGSGMDETKAVGMQAETAQAVVGAAVFLIAYDGMAEVLGMDADLVLSSGLQVEVHQRIVFVADEHLIMGDGIFAPVVGGTGIGDKHLVVFKPRLHGAFARVQTSFHHGHIAAVIDFLFPVLLERHGDLLVFGEEHQPGGVAVETVDGVGPATLLGGGEIVVQDALGRLLVLGRAVGEETFFFVDDHKVLVFIDDLEPFAVEAFFGGRFADFDGHARLQGEVELRCAVAIDGDHAVGQHVFHLGAADAVHFLHDELHQRSLFGHLEFQRVVFRVDLSFHKIKNRSLKPDCGFDVPRTGVEPALLSKYAPETYASTNSAIGAKESV